MFSNPLFLLKMSYYKIFHWQINMKKTRIWKTKRSNNVIKMSPKF